MSFASSFSSATLAKLTLATVTAALAWAGLFRSASPPPPPPPTLRKVLSQEAFSGPSEQQVEQQWQLIIRHLLPGDELGGLEKVRERLLPIMRQRRLNVYWGTAPTGSIHVGYLRPLSKLRDFLLAGCNVTILIADMHALLDSDKTKQDQLKIRSAYYVRTITKVLERMGAPMQRLVFQQGSSLAKNNPDYWPEFMRLSMQVTPAAAKKAASQVVKQERDPKLSGMLYPLLQVVDSVVLGADVELGGIDQVKIFALAEEKLPAGKAPVHLMNPMLPPLGKPILDKDGASINNKMSASGSDKLDLFDSPEEITAKLTKAFCEPGNVTHNGVLALWELLVEIQAASLLHDPDTGDLLDIASVRYEFEQKQLHPKVLKSAVAKKLVAFLAPLASDSSLRVLFENAYSSM